jgi:hypothetical protein
MEVDVSSFCLHKSADLPRTAENLVEWQSLRTIEPKACAQMGEKVGKLEDCSVHWRDTFLDLWGSTSDLSQLV